MSHDAQWPGKGVEFGHGWWRGGCRCLRMRLGAEEGPRVALFAPSRDRKRFRKGSNAHPSAPGPDSCSQITYSFSFGSVRWFI